MQIKADLVPIRNYGCACPDSQWCYYSQGGKQGPVLDAKKGLKINTETRAPTVGALVSVFILSLLNGLETRAQQTCKIPPRSGDSF